MDVKRVEELENGKTRVNLQYPVTVNNHTIERLDLRRPTAGDLKVMDNVKGDVAKQLAVGSRMAGEPVSVLEQLDASDFVVMGEVLGSMLGKSLGTGETS